MKKTKKASKPAKKAQAKKTVSKKPSQAPAHKPAVVNKSGIIPLGDRVLVRPLLPEETGTANSFGLIIPDTVSKEKPEQGVVVAVGDGKKNDDGLLMEVSVNVGDKILFNKYGYDEVKVGGVEYYIVSESNILAILA